MIRNYLKIAIRNILRHKVFSFINIFGLALSMSVCLLIILMLSDLNKYDQFHTHKNRIYRIISKNLKSGGPYYATTTMPLKEVLLNEYDGIEMAVGLKSFVGGDFRYGETITSIAGHYVDEDFFKVFSFELEQGNPETALKEPFSLVLTSESAQKLFKNENPIGKIVSFNDRGLNTLGISIFDEGKELGDFIVTGVMKNEEHISHINFDFLISMSTLYSLDREGKVSLDPDDWRSFFSYYLYILLEEGRSPKDIGPILSSISERQYEEFENIEMSFVMQSLTDITPGKMLNNMLSFRMPIEGVYFLMILAFLVIFSAGFNYTNLSIARALTRAREVGVRKVSGAYRTQIFTQFVCESVVIALSGLILAIVILQIIKPGFTGLWLNKYLNMELNQNVTVFLLFIVFSLIIGILAGILPAIYLSSFKPVTVLTSSFAIKENKGSGFFRKPGLGKTLIIAQFVISLLFIISTVLIYSQLNFIIRKEYGFSKDHLINVHLQGTDYQVFSNELSKHPEVIRVSASEYLPATGYNNGTSLISMREEPDTVYGGSMAVDRNFLDNLAINIVAGRNFPENISTEKEQYVLVNETAVKELGYDRPEDIIGEFFIERDSGEPLEVIGVTKDFFYEILFLDPIRPFYFRYIPKNYRYANIKIHGNDVQGTLSFVEDTWKKVDKIHTFEYRIFDQQLAETHGLIKDVVAIVGYISILAISIACLGLLGMAIFNTETRIKEIGIRKAMGADSRSIVLLLSKGFLILLGIAVIIGSPIAYLINNIWLQEFAFRVNFGIGIFGISISILLVLGLITIGSQTFRAANSNPATILRTE